MLSYYNSTEFLYAHFVELRFKTWEFSSTKLRIMFTHYKFIVKVHFEDFDIKNNLWTGMVE